jgi:hypothetical protein
VIFDHRKMPLTNASSGLCASQVFQLDLRADFRSRLLQPCQKGLTGAVKVRHRQYQAAVSGGGGEQKYGRWVD